MGRPSCVSGGGEMGGADAPQQADEVDFQRLLAVVVVLVLRPAFVGPIRPPKGVGFAVCHQRVDRLVHQLGSPAGSVVLVREAAESGVESNPAVSLEYVSLSGSRSYQPTSEACARMEQRLAFDQRLRLLREALALCPVVDGGAMGMREGDGACAQSSEPLPPSHVRFFVVLRGVGVGL
jgi:hypothetical protein